MAVYKRDLVDINLETGNIHRSFLKHSIGYKDAAADHFGIRVFRNGEPVSLTGVSVQGIFMPPQGDPIAITSGNIVSGNEAEVVLPQACYNYDGQFTLAIKLVDATNAVTGTMRIVDGMVDNTHASGTVAPTSAVPTYQEILATYDAMVAATTAATTAATNVGSIVAAAYSTSATYAVGDYCTKDGNLYRCTTAITTAESWTAAHWTQTKMGPDVSDLKSALDAETEERENADYDFQVGMALEASLRENGDTILEQNKVPYPESPLSKYGAEGQMLKSLGNGKTEWTNVGLPSDEQTATAVSDWLDNHPEATTTVQDWSLTNNKLVKGTLGFVMPEMFGAQCDGVTDDSQAIQDAIDYAHEHGCTFMGSGGVYAVADKIDLVTEETYDHPFNADFNGSTLKAIDELDEIIYINTEDVAGYDTPGRYPRFINNLILDGNGKADYGIHDVFGRSLYFINIKIYDILDTCFKSDENVNGGGLVIDTMVLDHNIELNPFVCGIDVGVSDAKISHVKMRNINKAVILRKSSCFLTDIHPYLASIWSFHDSVCYDLKAPSQHFESCYADTYEICWNLDVSQHIFSNCQVYWAMNLYPQSSEIPVIFNLASATLANYIVISSMLINAGSYYSTTGDKVHLFNFSGDQITGANLYDLMKTSAYANWDALDNIPVVADYSTTGNYRNYQNGSQVGQTKDINNIYDIGRYYTLGLNLPVNSPVSDQNFELVVEYELDQASPRRKHTVTTQSGTVLFRTCDINKNWGPWNNITYSQQATAIVPFQDGGSQTSDVTITFDRPFATTPAIMLTPIADSSNVNYAKAGFIVKSASTTGFVLRGIMETPTNFTAYVKWIALR